MVKTSGLIYESPAVKPKPPKYYLIIAITKAAMAIKIFTIIKILLVLHDEETSEILDSIEIEFSEMEAATVSIFEMTVFSSDVLVEIASLILARSSS